MDIGETSASELVHSKDDVPQQLKKGGKMPKSKWAIFFWRLSFWDYLLFFISVGLFIAAWVLGVLWWNETGTFRVLQSSLNLAQSTCPNDPDCLASADKVLSYMNSALDPCDNFYLYACDGFQSKYYTPNLITGQTSFPSLMTDKRTNNLIRILNDNRYDDLADLFSQNAELENIYNQMLSYFKGCKNVVGPKALSYLSSYSAADQANNNYLVTYTTSVITNMVIVNFLGVSDSTQLYKMYSYLWLISPNTIAQQRGYDLTGTGTFSNGPFDVNIFGRYAPSLKPILVLEPPILPLSIQNPNDNNELQGLKNIVQTIYMSLFPFLSNTTCASYANDIVNLNANLLTILQVRPTDYDPSWQNVSIAQLETQYPNIMKVSGGWRQFLSQLGFSDDILDASQTTPSPLLEIYVSSPQYFQQLDQLIASTTFDQMKRFLSFIALLNFSFISQLHGLPIPTFYNPSLPIGFDPYDTRISIGSSALGSGSLLTKFQKGAEKLSSEPFQFHVGSFEQPAFEHWQTSHAALKEGNWQSFADQGQESLVYRNELDHALLESATNNVCVKDSMEKFSLLLGKIFGHTILADSDKTHLKKIVQNVFEAAVNRLGQNNSQWLDQDSLNAALRKITMMEQVVGLPDALDDNNVIVDFYQGLSLPTTAVIDFFKNAVTMIQLLNKVQVREWKMDYNHLILAIFTDWTQPDAYYSKFMNKMILPYGFAQRTAYSPQNPIALNYGLLGFLVGHELSHALDPESTNYDEYGNYQPWMTSSSVAKYEQLSQCFVSFYQQGRYLYEYQTVDGQRTLAQNMADYGGLIFAWDAYKLQQKQSGSTILPGLNGFSDDQLFYLAYGQLFCTVQDPSITLIDFQTDSHVIPSLRVLISLGLNSQFTKTYSCPLGSNEYPDQNRCSLW